VVEDIVEFILQHGYAEFSGIIYCFSRKDTEELTGSLLAVGMRQIPSL
jgi:hypothetical protein